MFCWDGRTEVLKKTFITVNKYNNTETRRSSCYNSSPIWFCKSSSPVVSVKNKQKTWTVIYIGIIIIKLITFLYRHQRMNEISEVQSSLHFGRLCIWIEPNLLLMIKQDLRILDVYCFAYVWYRVWRALVRDAAKRPWVTLNMMLPLPCFTDGIVFSGDEQCCVSAKCSTFMRSEKLCHHDCWISSVFWQISYTILNGLWFFFFITLSFEERPGSCEKLLRFEVWSYTRLLEMKA